MYRTILLARVLDQKIWSLNRMGKAAFVVSGQGHEGAQVGSAWALRGRPRHRAALLPRHRRDAHPGHVGRADPPGRAGPGRRPQQRRPPDAEPLGLGRGWRDHRLLADRHPAPARRRARLRRQAPPGRPGGGQLLRRGRHLQGRLPRGAQLRRHPPAPDGLRLREQRLRHLGADVGGVGRRRRRRPRPRLRVRRGDRRRQRPARRVRRRPLGACAAPARATAPRSSSARPTATSPTPPTTTTARIARPQEVEAWRKKDPLRRITQYLHRAAAAVRGRRGAHRGRGARPRSTRPPRRPRPPPPATPRTAYAHVFAQPLRPVPGAPDGAEPTPPIPRSLARPRGRHRAQHRRHGALDPAAADGRPTIAWSSSVRTSVRAAVCSAPPTGWPPSSATTASSTRRSRRRSIIGIGIGLALAGLRPIAEIQFADFIHSGFDQLVSRGGPHPLPVQRRLLRAARGPGAVGRRRARRALPLAVDRGDLRPHPRPQGGGAVDPGRRVRHAARPPSRTPTPCSSSSTRRPTGSSRASSPTTTAGASRSAWPRSPGTATTSRSSPTACTATCASRRPRRLADEDGASVEVVDLRTISPARPRHRAGVGGQDRSVPGRPRGQHQLRRRRRGGGHRRRGGLLGPRRTGAPAGHRRRARATPSPARSRASCSSTPPRSQRRSARAWPIDPHRLGAHRAKPLLSPKERALDHSHDTCVAAAVSSRPTRARIGRLNPSSDRFTRTRQGRCHK